MCKGAFILLLVFLIVGILVAVWELISGIKKEPHLGPAGNALKEAFCGCFRARNQKLKQQLFEGVLSLKVRLERTKICSRRASAF